MNYEFKTSYKNGVLGVGGRVWGVGCWEKETPSGMGLKPTKKKRCILRRAVNQRCRRVSPT